MPSETSQSKRGDRHSVVTNEDGSYVVMAQDTVRCREEPPRWGEATKLSLEGVLLKGVLSMR